MSFFDISTFFDIDLNSLMMVIFVDLVLSGDNAIIIGMAAASLPTVLRQKAIVWGIGIAVILRIVLAALTFYLLQLTGIKILGSILLIFVCYMMWRDLTNKTEPELVAKNKDLKEVLTSQTNRETEILDNRNPNFFHMIKSAEFKRAMLKITIADITMSLDNVLAVAGIARESLIILIFGLGLSIVLMAIGANLVAKILEKHHWLGYIGLLIIFYVAIDMGYHGGIEVLNYFKL